MTEELQRLSASMEAAVREEFEALERLDISGQHRAVAKLNNAAKNILKFGDDGREIIERWLAGPDRQLQNAAAPLVYRWDPERAVQKLIEIARWALGPKSDILGQASIGIDSRMLLADHYRIPYHEVRTRILGLPENQNRDVG